MDNSFPTLITVAIAPILTCLFYIYIRDRYESEPIKLLLTGVLLGLLITFPIIYTQNFVTFSTKYLNLTTVLQKNLYQSFVVAGFVEEFFKFLVLYFLVWKNKNFNEPFDGIVYSVFISLGFSASENILYVLNDNLGGIQTGIARGIFSVPAHGFFAVSMGYHFAMSKFKSDSKSQKRLFLANSLLVPITLHGLYNFILLTNNPYWFAVFIIFMAILWLNGLHKIKTYVELSPFKKIVD